MTKIRERFNNLNPLIRGIAYFFGGLLLLLLIFQIIISLFADDYAANTIKERFEQSSESAYTLDFEELDLNIFTGSASIQNLQIKADTTFFSDTSASAPSRMLLQGSVGEVEVSGFSLFSTLTGDELHIGNITLSNPDISALKNPYQLSSDSSKSSFGSIDSSIYAVISDQYTALELDEFIIDDGHGLFTHKADTIASLGKLNLSLRNIRVDSASAQSGRIFVTDDIAINAQNFTYHLSDSLNTIAFDQLTLSSVDQNIILDSLKLIPKYSKLAFARQHGSRIDRIDLSVPKLEIQSFDYAQFISTGRFYAQSATINNLSLEDYLNRGLPGGPPQPKPLPFVTFRDLKQKIKIDSLHIRSGFISYSEYVGNTPRAGTVTFEDLDATFRNISNFEGDIQQGLTTTLETQSKVMGAGLLETHFEFPMDTEMGFHTIRGNLAPMDITDFNRITEHVAFVRIDRGNLNSLKFEMRLNDDQSSGSLIMDYEDAKISVLDKQSVEQKGLIENLKTFFANNMVVRENNTPETGMQAGQIKFQRIKHKSIFNYWWKSLLTGIKDSMTK
ncbi:hypothetical protein [Fodinibius salsisoli]|uniref:AsmA-like C-terminal region n=1 Tax=Fodinibius salsisoli TaxID=2820877 RepID=A0ABT3PLD0_9BACT|nr:hypothetical protein [Fodinibius salsisoli]MCW9706707.1 hypothetical protein [Fodinibius salsisoli]